VSAATNQEKIMTTQDSKPTSSMRGIASFIQIQAMYLLERKEVKEDDLVALHVSLGDEGLSISLAESRSPGTEAKFKHLTYKMLATGDPELMAEVLVPALKLAAARERALRGALPKQVM
jgi:hypothetical protein